MYKWTFFYVSEFFCFLYECFFLFQWIFLPLVYLLVCPSIINCLICILLMIQIVCNLIFFRLISIYWPQSKLEPFNGSASLCERWCVCACMHDGSRFLCRRRKTLTKQVYKGYFVWNVTSKRKLIGTIYLNWGTNKAHQELWIFNKKMKKEMRAIDKRR